MLGPQGISPAISFPLPLAGKPSATVDGSNPARVKEMATELEATFLSLLLKEMRQTLDPDGGLFPGDTGDVHGGLFDLYLSRHLADGGGVGLAAALVRHMQETAPKPATTNDHGTGTDRPSGSLPPAPRV